VVKETYAFDIKGFMYEYVISGLYALNYIKLYVNMIETVFIGNCNEIPHVVNLRLWVG